MAVYARKDFRSGMILTTTTTTTTGDQRAVITVKTPRPSCSKQDYVNPGLVSTSDPVLEPSDEHVSKSFLPYVQLTLVAFKR